MGSQYNCPVKRTWCAALLILALSGCVHSGPDLNLRNAERVKLGMNAAEVQAIMGEPDRTHVDANEELWIWSPAPVRRSEGGGEGFSVGFEDGNVIYTLVFR